MSSLISDDSGTPTDLDITSRAVTVASTTSAATDFMDPLNEAQVNNTCIQLAISAKSPLRSSESGGSDNSYIDDNPINGPAGSVHLSLMQTSPPPHSYRHSRAYRHFKNPPQPHMCIRTTTEAGEELFINVLSWTRIVIPQEPTDPIPLYGGMRVPPGNPRSPPIVFAVMANPEVLKDSGRHSKDPEERKAMVELMCDFVEAMNPGVKLVRSAVILRDRDISGELKDVWNAVQAQRDREREEQIIQQRQQQHFHNITTQQMFPKLTDGVRITEQKQGNNTSPENAEKMLLDSYAESSKCIKNDTFITDSGVILRSKRNLGLYIDGQMNSSDLKEATIDDNAHVGVNSIGISANGKDQTDATNCLASKAGGDGNMEEIQESSFNKQLIKSKNSEDKNKSNGTEPCHNIVAPSTLSADTVVTTLVASAAIAPTTTKKDKLVGFLPNGCIFPRFKNNKHKEKEKEGKTKDKERTLLNALKKSKDKKVAAIENSEKPSSEIQNKLSYEKNSINLESEVQKLDLNKIETPTNGENVFIKLKMATDSAAAK